jgi:hypothetical protein
VRQLPLTEIRMRDPFILESSPGAFVLLGTTDENLWGGPATGFDCYTSSDLATWEGPIAAFRPPEGFWSDTQFWAPEVHAYVGAFYLFATFASSETHVRGVAVLRSEQATGPFQPWSDGPVTPAALPCLDATFFVDDEAQPWIIYSRGAEGIPGGEPPTADGEMYARRLAPDLRAPLEEPVLLFTASAAPWAKPLRFPEGVEPPEQLNLAKDPLFTDGPFIVRSPDDSLLMTWSSFGDEGYAIGIAHSPNGSVLGPWTQAPHPLWARNGGHGMILHTTSETNHLVFHSPNETPNERVQLVDVEIGSDGIRLTST